MARSRKRTTTVPTLALHSAAQIPLNRLRLSESNVRTLYSTDSIASLSDSIARRGLLQSLNVRALLDEQGEATGHYEVPAGGRRFRALQSLVAAGRLAADAPIPCIISTGGLAEDDSLAENSDREALHPLDEFRAFAALKAKGKSVEDIAAAYRVTAAVVRQRLRLAAASPVLLEVYVAGNIDLDDLMAFCVTDDAARQEAVYKDLAASGQMSEWIIKRRLTEQTVRADDPRACFIGIDAYEAAGGRVVRDLFDAANTGYLQDIDLLNRMVENKLATIGDTYRAQGWKWVRTAASFGYDVKNGLNRLIGSPAELTEEQQKQLAAADHELGRLEAVDDLTDDEQGRLDELQEQIEQLENLPPVYTSEDMARAGVFISLQRDGRLHVDAGYILPEDDVVDASENDEPVSDVTLAEAEPASQDVTAAIGLPAALVRDLTGYRTVALRNALANDPRTAYLALLHVLVLQHLYKRGHHSCLQVSSHCSFPAGAEDLDAWTATVTMKTRDDAWRQRLPRDPADLWDALCGLPDDDRRALFAHVVAMSVNAVRIPNLTTREAQRHANQLATAVGLHMTSAGWVPTVANYFGRITKAQILADVTEAKGSDTAELLADLKKDAMAVEAERLVQGTGWVPDILRTPMLADAASADQETGPLPSFLQDAQSA